MAIAFTDAFIKNLTLTGRHTDASIKGLNIQVKPNGGKYWTFRYLLQGKRTDLSLGTYPSVGLKAARARATDARVQLNKGEYPKAGWKAQPAVTRKQVEASKVLFKDYALECIAAKRSEWRNSKHAEQWLSTIAMYANPVIGNKSISEVDMDDILEILNPIWYSKTVTATRLRGRLEWVLASATARKLRTGANPATWKGLLETILPKPGKIKNEQHHAALSYLRLPAFVRQLHEMDGVAALALEFLVLNANRTGEVIGARRDEVSDAGMWTIPGQRMKIGKEHRVPLGIRSAYSVSS